MKNILHFAETLLETHEVTYHNDVLWSRTEIINLRAGRIFYIYYFKGGEININRTAKEGLDLVDYIAETTFAI
jgi:hypothetical protein